MWAVEVVCCISHTCEVSHRKFNQSTNPQFAAYPTYVYTYTYVCREILTFNYDKGSYAINVTSAAKMFGKRQQLHRGRHPCYLHSVNGHCGHKVQQLQYLGSATCTHGVLGIHFTLSSLCRKAKDFVVVVMVWLKSNP